MPGKRKMKKRLCWLLISVLLGSFSGGQVQAACRNPHLVEEHIPFLKPAAASGMISITWYGHAFFEITSSSGTKIITDPFGAMGYPMPNVWPQVVTIGRESGNHNNAALAKGSPLILRGVSEFGREWNMVNTTFRDVLIYNVPIHQRGVPDYLRGSGFVFELDGLCVFHTGDVGEAFNEDQLQLIGHVDIVLLPIGGAYTMGPENARKVLEQLKPKVAVPMHYYYQLDLLNRFVEGSRRTRFLDTNTFSISKDTLPPETEIIIPKVQWFRDAT